mmetsp:Transcript_23314/g.43632  ORF Transcript_23314/g.43632 Transcript_23314/m.43632 type:complete len:98 (+) Transcript_23314:534-827(+)
MVCDLQPHAVANFELDQFCLSCTTLHKPYQIFNEYPRKSTTVNSLDAKNVRHNLVTHVAVVVVALLTVPTPRTCDASPFIINAVKHQALYRMAIHHW